MDNIIEHDNSISIISTCMDRNFHLEESIPTWLKVPKIKDIIIVDWSSKIPVIETVKKFNSNKIIVLRIDERDYWDASMARNVGIRYSKSPFLFMVDADIKIRDTIFSYITPNNEIFYTGGPKENTMDASRFSTCGTCIISREMFLYANGYNENIRKLGLCKEDSYFYKSLKPRFRWYNLMLKHFLDEIPHSNELRLENGLESNYEERERKSIDFIANNKDRWVMKNFNITIYLPNGTIEYRNI